ncbi:MAG: SpoIIIAH-like family protein [Acetivibrio ethanolgignens]
MKNIFRKNQVIITALAIMIAVAGYLNFAEEKGATTETATYGELGNVEDTSQIDLGLTESDPDYEISDATLAEAENETEVGDAVLVGNTIGSDFFSSARLNREQTRAKNKEMLMEIVNNANVSEAQKQEAVDNVVKLTNIAEKETATENLLAAKGFSDVVVSIVDDSVDVIVNANDLTEQQIAQIEDIVKRKTEISAENIVISPVGVKN